MRGCDAVYMTPLDDVYIHYLGCGLYRFRPYGGSLFSRARIAGPEKSNQKGPAPMSGPPSSGSLVPVLLRGHAAIGHPWPGAASAASMPRCPLRNACARPSKVALCGVCDIAARHTMIAPTRSVRNDQAFLFAFNLHPPQPRHHKTRLGCRPTERRRSEGTRRSRAKSGLKRFWLLLSLLQK